jgi:hypothetical protein
MADQLAALENELAALRAPVQQVVQTTQAAIDNDRRWIARLVLWAFALASGAVLIATPLLAWFKPQIWEETSKSMLAVVAQVLLPVVTLVIGFYFRNEQK